MGTLAHTLCSLGISCAGSEVYHTASILLRAPLHLACCISPSSQYLQSALELQRAPCLQQHTCCISPQGCLSSHRCGHDPQKPATHITSSPSLHLLPQTGTHHVCHQEGVRACRRHPKGRAAALPPARVRGKPTRSRDPACDHVPWCSTIRMCRLLHKYSAHTCWDSCDCRMHTRT